MRTERNRGGDAAIPVKRLRVNSHPYNLFTFFSDSFISKVLHSASLLSYSSSSLPDTPHPPQNVKEKHPSARVLLGKSLFTLVLDISINQLGADILAATIMCFSDYMLLL